MKYLTILILALSRAASQSFETANSGSNHDDEFASLVSQLLAQEISRDDLADPDFAFEKMEKVVEMAGEKMKAAQSDDRSLTELPSIHCPYFPGASTETVTFNVDVNIIPAGDHVYEGLCFDNYLRTIGRDINHAFVSLGLGPIDAEIRYLGVVCEDPEGSTGNRIRGRRSLQSGFTYRGGGPCRNCNRDNFDHGNAIFANGTVVTPPEEEPWFPTYAQEMEANLLDYIDNEIFSGNRLWVCFGTDPIFHVSITQVASQDDVQFGCQ